VANVLVDGSSVGVVTSYTFTNVTASHTIAASFAIDTYTINASAGANGSISPSGAVTVNYGANQAFTITPAAHYHVADVLVDSISVGAVTNYTFTSVSANHTIAASFAIIVEADFYSTPTLTFAKHDIKFFDRSTGEPNQWAWDFGDNNYSTVQNPVHAYDAPDTYTVSLSVSGPYGSDTETKKDYIVIKRLPTKQEFIDFLLGRTESLDGDINGDGKIDVSDLVMCILITSSK
jgi:PKD repeat protein